MKNVLILFSNTGLWENIRRFGEEIVDFKLSRSREILYIFLNFIYCIVIYNYNQTRIHVQVRRIDKRSCLCLWDQSYNIVVVWTSKLRHWFHSYLPIWKFSKHHYLSMWSTWNIYIYTFFFSFELLFHIHWIHSQIIFYLWDKIFYSKRMYLEKYVFVLFSFKH